MKLFIFGFGYTARAFVRAAGTRFSQITAAVRSVDAIDEAASFGVMAYAVDGNGRTHPEIADAIIEADAILVCAPPSKRGDPAIFTYGDIIALVAHPKWIGYLSTLGVYGDAGGNWVDETTSPAPVNDRSRNRLVAERQWLMLGQSSGLPVHVFRLAGIYGPGRSALDKVASGEARRIVKPGQIFNRIHVDDIARVLIASLSQPRAGAIYNVCDDEPCDPCDVVTFAAQLLNASLPPAIPFESAALSPMAASFFGETKRARNDLIKQELKITLAFPSYREGLLDLLSHKNVSE